MYHQFNIHNSTFYPHRVFKYFVSNSEKKERLFLHTAISGSLPEVTFTLHIPFRQYINYIKISLEITTNIYCKHLLVIGCNE
jgi:hypothetical protein